MRRVENHDRAGLAALLADGDTAQVMDVICAAVLEGRTRAFETSGAWLGSMLAEPAPTLPGSTSSGAAGAILAALVERERSVVGLLRAIGRDGPPVHRRILLELLAGQEPDEVERLQPAFDRALDTELCLELTRRKDGGRFQQDIAEEVLQEILLARQAHRSRVLAAVLRDEENASALIDRIEGSDRLLAQELREATKGLAVLVEDERMLVLITARMSVRDLAALLRGEEESVVTTITGRLTTRKAEELREELGVTPPNAAAARSDARMRLMELLTESTEEVA